MSEVVRLAGRTNAPSLAIATHARQAPLVIDPRDGRRLDAEGAFNFGSIAKTFTAAVLSALVLDGTLQLEWPIRSVCDESWLPSTTFLELATHTSGLPREAPKYSAGILEIDSRDGLAAALQAVSRRASGTYRYSNLGYLVLGYAIEQVAGRPLPELVRDLLFEPLGMRNMRYTTDADPSSVVGVRIDNGAPVVERVTVPGAGGFYGTASDLVRWADALVAPPDSLGAIIDLATRARVRLGAFDAVPGTWNFPSPRRRRAIGLAWRLEADGLTWHTGGTNGFTSFCAANRRTGSITVALLAAGIGALPDSPRSLPSLAQMLRLRGWLMKMARTERANAAT